MTAKKQINVLITGFGLFPGMPDNPSAALVKSFLASEKSPQKSQQRKYKLYGGILPTEFSAGIRKFDALMKSVQPDIVICFGVAARRRIISLETTARNKVGLKLKDAAGHKHKSSKINRKSQRAYTSTLPLRKINNALKNNDIRARLSDNAGSYLCNFIFFRLMEGIYSGKYTCTGGFIHIPNPKHSKFSSKTVEKAAKIAIQASISSVKPS